MNIRLTIGTTIVAILLELGTLALVVLIVRHVLKKDRGNQGLAVLRSLPWHDRDAIVMMLIFFGAQGLAALAGPGAASLLGLEPERAVAAGMAIAVFAFPLIGLMTLASLARRRSIRTATWFGVHQTRDLWRRGGSGLLYYLASLPFISAAAIFAELLLRAVNYPADRQPVLDLLLDPSYPAWLRMQIAVVAVTLVPLVEESIFRGMFLPIALRHARPGIAVGATALIFATLHMHVPSLAPLFVLSCAFSVAYLRTGSLLVPVVMHMLFNGVSIGLALLIGDVPELF